MVFENTFYSPSFCVIVLKSCSQRQSLTNNPFKRTSKTQTPTLLNKIRHINISIITLVEAKCWSGRLISEIITAPLCLHSTGLDFCYSYTKRCEKNKLLVLNIAVHGKENLCWNERWFFFLTKLWMEYLLDSTGPVSRNGKTW